MNNKLIITPKTKIGELLTSYPELEDVLIELAPAFAKLKNPVLRKTIAKIATLEQAASVGNTSVDKIVNRLRAEIGQDKIENLSSVQSDKFVCPKWFSREKIVKTLDARPIIQMGGHPLGDVLTDLQKLVNGDIYELITPFMPAPLVDKVVEMGFQAWTEQESPELFKNYFSRSQGE